MFYAHSLAQAPQSLWQPLEVHLKQSAALAAAFAQGLGLERAAALAALLHDLGKYNPAFQQRLSGDPARVEHAIAGAVQVVTMGQGLDQVLMRLLAYAIAGHHAGLPDYLGPGALQQRIAEYDLTVLDPIWRSELEDALAGLNLAIPLFPKMTWRRENFPFQLAMLGRFIFSCLVDADYKDTESFYAQHEAWTPARAWPCLSDQLPQLIAAFDRHMASLAQAAQARQETTAAMAQLNQRRAEILKYVRAQACLKPGLFTLNVPTGGGKTLASLGFALDHARQYGLERIIYAIPFTSIIDQTATIFRQVLGDDYVLEHHCAIEMNQDQSRQAKSKLALAMEDWAAPVVVTTNVQFFESLFAARPSRCRKLHHIARSVVILDEAQTIPRGLLAPAVQALKELALNYQCSIVLCTATQPALNSENFAPDSKLRRDLGLALDGRELAPEPARLAEAFRRVRLIQAGVLSDAQLIDALADVEQGLIIVNSRRHARHLFETARGQGLSGLYHLSTRQYAHHRRALLQKIRNRLGDGQACRVIATSLVEAGVDIDFPRVWRAEAGLEQVVQAAGRCNREGRRPLAESIVSVFSAPDHPPPRDVKALWQDWQRAQASLASTDHPANVAARIDADPQEGIASLKDAAPHTDFDPLSQEALDAYFGEVYWRLGDSVDAKKILEQFLCSEYDKQPQLAYRTVAERFRMIESGLEPVIIVVDEVSRGLIAQLQAGVPSVGRIARQLQPYLVQIPPQARNHLLKNQHVQIVRADVYGSQFIRLSSAALYDEEIGLKWEDADSLGLSNSVI